MIGHKRVPPEGDPESKIWFIGEAPGEDEELEGRPFVGRAGQLLESALNNVGLFRSNIYLTNLSQFRPYYNKFETLLNTEQLESGLKSLLTSIEEYKPRLIVPLGNWPLKYLVSKGPISKYRGSILPYNEFTKVIPTYHPSYILRNSSEYPTFAADISRIKSDGEFDGLDYTERTYYIAPMGADLEDLVSRFEQAPRLACDIESIKNSKQIICHGFALSKHEALVLPNNDYYQGYIHRLYNCPAEKIFHYGMYDSLMLDANGYKLNNYVHDTFNLASSIEPELPRGLDWLTSIYTREPYYKSEGRGEIPDNTKVWSQKADKNKLYIYNGKDCCCTYEIFEKLYDPDNAIYSYLMSITKLALDIGAKGLYVDQEKLEYMKLAVAEKLGKLQTALNILAGKTINVNSPTQVPKLLYETYKLPVRRKRAQNGKASRVTTDEDAIVSLLTYVTGYINNLKTESAKAQWGVKKEALKLILEIRGLRKVVSSYLNVNLEDNRAKSTYAVAATDTHRWAASKYIADLGFNAMTMPREALELPENPQPDFDMLKFLQQIIKEDNESGEAEVDSESDSE